VLLLKKIFSYRSRLIVYLLLVFFLNLILINLPLLNVFGYELSVFNSVLLTFVSGFYIISFAKKEKENAFPDKNRDGFHKKFPQKLILPSILFLLIPFLVSVINSFFTGFCSFSDGLLFYIVITFPSVIIGFACGLVSSFLFKRFRRILFFILIILILLIALGEFYFNPQVYFYNPVLGFLPGTIYDEGLTVDLKLVMYRLLNLFFFGGLLTGIIFHLSGKIKFNKIFFILYLIIIPVASIFLSPSFGFSTTFGKLKSELNNHISTEHFDIYFDKEISDHFVKLIILHHEYFYRELKEYLNTTTKEKIQSFIFNNSQQKKILFGSANADVAKPWLYSTFTTNDNYNLSLKHEIAHCFSAEFGEGPFKIADMINPFLIEGIASACSPFYDENDLDFLASIAYKNGYKINLEKMYDFASFFTQTSSLSYIYAGSFTKFLIDNYGIEKFKQLYSDLDFQKIYSKSINELGNEYLTYLNKFDTDGKEDKANYYFGRKSIFYKVCPRFIADRIEKAWNHFQNKEYKEAEEIFKYTLNRAETYSSIIGLANTVAEMDLRDSSIAIIKKYLDNFDNTAYYYNLEFNLSDLYAEKGNIEKADSIYKKLFNQNPNTTIYYLSDLRRVLLNKENRIKDYLSGNNTEKYSILKELNKKNYMYSSFPVMVDLSKNLDGDYLSFIKQFDKTFFVNSYISAYSLFRLSEYMAENLDFSRARKMAALSLRFKEDYSLNSLLKENYKKLNWFYQNSETILNKSNFIQNNRQ
jgi:hypothetical protein